MNEIHDLRMKSSFHNWKNSKVQVATCRNILNEIMHTRYQNKACNMLYQRTKFYRKLTRSDTWNNSMNFWSLWSNNTKISTQLLAWFRALIMKRYTQPGNKLTSFDPKKKKTIISLIISHRKTIEPNFKSLMGEGPHYEENLSYLKTYMTSKVRRKTSTIHPCIYTF